MGRLIDADKYKGKVIASHTGSGVIKLIAVDDVPTDYDVDKVVQQLENEKEIHSKNYSISIYKDMPEIKQRYKQAIGILDKAIEIVKAELKRR